MGVAAVNLVERLEGVSLIFGGCPALPSVKLTTKWPSTALALTPTPERDQLSLAGRIRIAVGRDGMLR